MAHAPFGKASPPVYVKWILNKSIWCNWNGVLFATTLKLIEPLSITAVNVVAKVLTYSVAWYSIELDNSRILNTKVVARQFCPTTIVFLRIFVDELPNPIKLLLRPLENQN